MGGLHAASRWDFDDFRIWEEILRHSPQSLSEIFRGSDEEAGRLRQSSPFAGLIPEDVRQHVLASGS